jgi:UDP-N-acetylmuramyl pentapeptide phosphotransferase/UDP-N-acetylglucosamine-1-phosphate transferase
LPRFLFQIAAVGAVVVAAGGEMQFAPALPLAVERAAEIVAGVWFVNLVNFLDGLDWMTVAEMVPLTAALALFSVAAGLAGEVGLVAMALLGALVGFAPFNRPVARLFLGDVGSLPIGLLAAWLLYRLALSGAVAAALLLPLYYVADATVTLARLLLRGERVWEAHRSHYYQQATDNGFTVPAVVASVFTLNLVLAALAAATLAWPHPAVQALALGAGGLAVAFVLRRFGRKAPAEVLPG